MLLGAGDGPTASGDPPAASSATCGLVLAVKEVVDGLWEEHAAEIKRRCAPSMPKGLIDRQEVFGFVLADALGRPLLPPEEARNVGQAGDNAVAGALGSGRPPNRRKGKLEKANDAAREALRKARVAAAKDVALQPAVAAAEKALKAALEAVYAERVDLKLPNATVGAKRKRVQWAEAEAAEALHASHRDSELRSKPRSIVEIYENLTRELTDSHERVCLENERLAHENEQLRRELCALRPFLPPLERWERIWEDGSRTFERCELKETTEVAEEEEPWDEETAARAQAEMIAAHRK